MPFVPVRKMKSANMLFGAPLLLLSGLGLLTSACAIDPNLPPTVKAAQASRQVADDLTAYGNIRPHRLDYLPRPSPRDAIELETLMNNIEALLRVAAIATSAGKQIATIREAQLHNLGHLSQSLVDSDELAPGDLFAHFGARFLRSCTVESGVGDNGPSVRSLPPAERL